MIKEIEKLIKEWETRAKTLSEEAWDDNNEDTVDIDVWLAQAVIYQLCAEDLKRLL